MLAWISRADMLLLSQTKTIPHMKKAVHLLWLLSLIFLSCIKNKNDNTSAGNLDNSFNPGLGIVSGVGNCLALQPDGKIIVGGGFQFYDGTERRGIVRINHDGSLDRTFNPGQGTGGGANLTVRSIALQPDGKIIIGGAFTHYDGIPRRGIARVNADGSLDHTFNPGTGAPGLAVTSSVRSVRLLPDGKIIVGGGFSFFNTIPAYGMVRLHPDGSIDTTFDMSTNIDGPIETIVPADNGKMYIGGWFSYINGLNIKGIARLNADGTLDETFRPGGNYTGILSIAVQADNKPIFISTSMVRLNTNGSIDHTFNATVNSNTTYITLQPDGKLLIGGYLLTEDGTYLGPLVRMHADGSLDKSFSAGKGVSGPTLEALLVQPDGKVVITGMLTEYNGQPFKGIARIYLD